MGDGRRQFSHRNHAGHAGEIVLCLTQLLFGPPLLAHVNTRADVTGKRAVGIESWRPDVVNQSKFAVVPSKPILHSKWLSAIKGLNIRSHATSHILRMDALRPAAAKLLFKGPASEVQPRLIKVGTKLVSPRHPDHHRSAIGHQPKA